MVPYWDLEDYRLGMYDKVHFSLEDYLIEKSIVFLSNQDLFFDTGLKMIDSFTQSSKFHLKNVLINRQAWIGQASCFFYHGTPEYLTRKSWTFLPRIEMIKANQTADRLIKFYETKDKKIHNQMGFGL